MDMHGYANRCKERENQDNQRRYRVIIHVHKQQRAAVIEQCPIAVRDMRHIWRILFQQMLNRLLLLLLMRRCRFIRIEPSIQRVQPGSGRESAKA